MQMYYWNDCDFWRGHFAKRIIVLAKNVKEARIKAVAEATLWIKAEVALTWDEGDAEFLDFVEQHIKQFKLSIAKRPIAQDVIFIL